MLPCSVWGGGGEITWMPWEKRMHTNLLELRAVQEVCKTFLTFIQSHHILIMSDNVTIVVYINKWGRSKNRFPLYGSSQLMELVYQELYHPVSSVPSRNPEFAGREPQQALCHQSRMGVARFSGEQPLNSVGSPDLWPVYLPSKQEVQHILHQGSSRPVLQRQCSRTPLDKLIEVCPSSYPATLDSLENLTGQSTNNPHHTQMAQTVLGSRSPRNVDPSAYQTQENSRVRHPNLDAFHLMAWYLVGHWM